MACPIKRSDKYDEHLNMRLRQQLNELNLLMGRKNSDINISSENGEMNGENGEDIDNES